MSSLGDKIRDVPTKFIIDVIYDVWTSKTSTVSSGNLYRYSPETRILKGNAVELSVTSSIAAGDATDIILAGEGWHVEIHTTIRISMWPLWAETQTGHPTITRSGFRGDAKAMLRDLTAFRMEGYLVE